MSGTFSRLDLRRRLAHDPRGLLWWGIVGGLSFMTLLACSGLLATTAFQQYSQIKWLITLFAPVVVVLLMLAKNPVTYLAGAVVFGLPFTAVYVSVRSLHVPAIAVLLVAGVVVAFLTSDRPGSRPPERVSNRIGLAAFITTLLLLPAGVRGLDPALWFVQVAVVAATGYVVSRACHVDPSAPRFVLTAFAGSVGLQGLLAVREFQTGRPFSAYGASRSYSSDYFFGFEGVIRPSAMFSDPISLGNVLALACPILVVIACRSGVPPLLRLWFALCVLGAAGGLVLTLSRMSWVGAVVGVVAVVLLSPGGDRLRQVIFLAVGAFIVAGTAVTLAGPSLLPRFNSIFNPTATGVVTANGDELRKLLWHASFEVFSAHPIFGVGTGNLHATLVQNVGDAGQFAHAHSTYLQNLAESGLLGGLAIAVMAYASGTELLVRLRSSRFDDPYARACAGALVTLAVVWTTDFTIRYTAVLLTMAIPFILLTATRQRAAGPPADMSYAAPGVAAPATGTSPRTLPVGEVVS